MQPVRIYELEFTPLPGCDLWDGDIPEFNCFTFAYIAENADWEDGELLANWADSRGVAINSASLIVEVPANAHPFETSDERADLLAFAREHEGVAFSPFFATRYPFDESTVRFSDALVDVSPTPARDDWPPDAIGGYVRVKAPAPSDRDAEKIIHAWAANERFVIVEIEFEAPFRSAPEPRWPDEGDEFSVAALETPAGTTFAYVGRIHLYDGADDA